MFVLIILHIDRYATYQTKKEHLFLLLLCEGRHALAVQNVSFFSQIFMKKKTL